MQLKAKMLGHLNHHPLRERATPVINGIENLLRGRLNFRVIVAPLTHLRTQLRIGTPSLLRRCGMLTGMPYQLFVQPNQRLEGLYGKPPAGVNVRQAQRLIQRCSLRAF